MAKTRKHGETTPPLDPAAVQAMMERALGGAGGKRGTDEERAQELVCDAMEACTQEDCLRLLLEALELDSENVDALLIILAAAPVSGEERIKLLRDIVATGARRLGKKAFAELAPHFWGFLETRPYMRARYQLAEALSDAGRLDEAAVEYTEMLALNENDNQGMRYLLLPILLASGRLDEARSLIERYKDECEWSVVFAWCRVLERFLSGNNSGAVEALADARKQNRHMEAYIKGKRKIPRKMPASYSPGSKEEAVCFADVLRMAFRAHPEAVTWMGGY